MTLIVESKHDDDRTQEVRVETVTETPEPEKVVTEKTETTVTQTEEKTEEGV